MNWKDFTAALIKSLAWPGTVLILAFYFRKLIKKAFLKLTRLKYGELEVDFGQELKQVEKEAKAINILPQPPKSIAPTKKDSWQLLEEASHLAQQFPEPAVAVAWQAVEVQLLDSVIDLGVPFEQIEVRHTLGHAHILVEKNVIDMATLEVLRRMHKLRNLAVHGTYGPGPVTADEAREFLALAKGIVDKLRTARRSL